LDDSEWRFSAMFALEVVHRYSRPFRAHQTQRAHFQGITFHNAVMLAVAGDNSPVQVPGISVGLLAVLIAYTGSQFAPSLLVSAFLN